MRQTVNTIGGQMAIEVCTESEDRRPGITAMVQALLPILRDVNEAQCYAKSLYTNEEIIVRQRGRFRRVPNPHQGGKNLDQLANTLERMK